MTIAFKTRDITSVDFLGERVDFITSNDRLLDRVTSLSNEKYILNKLAKVSDKDDIFWDIGSCLGIHSFILSNQLRNGKVVSFEPMPSNRAISIDNKSVNDFDNIIIDERALAEQSDEREFEIRQSVEPGYGRHGLSIGDGYDSVKTITVPTVKADMITEYPQPNIVKIDVEGAGPLVLEGMEHTLKNPDCKYVIFETHEPNPVQPSHEDLGYTVEDIKDLLRSYGFSVSSMENEYHLFCEKQEIEKPYTDVQNTAVSYVQGDITSFSADAAINSVGSSLYFGTGVAGALRESAGESLQQAVLEHTPLTVSDSIITNGYNSPYTYLIHAASMPHYREGQSTEASIYKSVSNSIQIANKHPEIQSIVCPAVGCGLGGVPLTNGIQKILQAINMNDTTNIDTIRICLYSEDEYETINNIY